jgi:hypothetical protein
MDQFYNDLHTSYLAVLNARPPRCACTCLQVREKLLPASGPAMSVAFCAGIPSMNCRDTAWGVRDGSRLKAGKISLRATGYGRTYKRNTHQIEGTLVPETALRSQRLLGRRQGLRSLAYEFPAMALPKYTVT